MTTIRRVYQEQDATLIIRLPSSMKSWLVETADEVPDISMADLVRHAIRELMDVYDRKVREVEGQQNANDNL